MLTQLGDFQFNLSTIAAQEVERISQYRFAEQERIGQQNLLQAVGRENEIIRITGWLSPELQAIYGGRGNPLDELRMIADTQEPQILITEDGRNLGYWVIFGINTRSSLFLPRGQGARRMEFTIQLKYYGFGQFGEPLPFAIIP